ncbi:MAG: GNAT family N-acetyltransferase [Planctomycetota bacterium]
MSPARLAWEPRVPPEARAGVLKLLAASVRDDAMLGLIRGPTAAEGRAWLDGLDEDLSEGRTHLLLARAGEGEDVLGLLCLDPARLATQRHLVTLRRAIVHPRARGTALLLRALERVLERCAHHGWTTLIADVRAGTRSERLWRRLGFREYGRLDNYAHHAGRVHAGVFLTATPEELECKLRPRIRRLSSHRPDAFGTSCAEPWNATPRSTTRCSRA